MPPWSKPSSKTRKPEEIIHDLSLPERFSLEDLFGAVERKQDRPLRVKVASLPPEYSALWVQTSQANYIVLAAGLPQLQRNQASVHEVAHMLLRHRPNTVTSPEDLRVALGLPAHMQALARSGYHYGSEEEAAAEALATALCARLEAMEQDDRAARFQRDLT